MDNSKNNKCEKYEKDFQECEKYPHPAILMDADFNIIYKNGAAKAVNIKPRMGTNIKKYMDGKNIEKLCGAVEKEEYKILKLNVPSPIKRCILHPGRKEIKALIFFDTFNFLREDGPDEAEIIRKIENIIFRYNEKEKQEQMLGKLVSGTNFSAEGSRKIIKIKEHFRRHMVNLNPQIADKHKTYCDIGEFLNNFTSGISQYIHSYGYKITSSIENNMFFYSLNGNDFLLINFILSAVALKYSIFNKIDIQFFSDFKAGLLRYEFKTENDFDKTHKDMFVKDYLDEIKDMEYLDLNLAALIAKNNDMKLRVYFKGDDGNKVCLDLLFGVKDLEISSENFDKYQNNQNITAEKITEFAKIVFAGIFRKDI